MTHGHRPGRRPRFGQRGAYPPDYLANSPHAIERGATAVEAPDPPPTPIEASALRTGHVRPTAGVVRSPTGPDRVTAAIARAIRGTLADREEGA